METYVGHRYVPKIIGEWNKLLSYENLSIVTFDNSSYTSKTIVPVGVEISNEKYWVKTGDYNAQVEEFKNDFTAQLAQTKGEVFKRQSNVKARPMITIDSDDGRIEDYNVLYPILKNKGVPCTISIPPNKIGLNGRLSWEIVQELVDEGWSVSSHTRNEVILTDITDPEELDYQLREGKRLIEDAGFKADYLTYPTGAFNEEVVKVAKKYYKSAGTITRGIQDDVVRSMELNRTSLMSQPIDIIKTYIDWLEEAGEGWTTIYTHGLDLVNDPSLITKLEEIIDYALSKGIEFANHDDAWEIYGNLIDLGMRGYRYNDDHFVISYQGDIIRNNVKLQLDSVRTHEVRKDININTPIDAFELNAITHYLVESTLFPEGKNAGILTVKRFTEWTGYSSQEYQPSGSKALYRRLWVREGGVDKWTEFVPVINPLLELPEGVSESGTGSGKQVIFPEELYLPDNNFGVIVTPHWNAGNVRVTNRVRTNFYVGWDTPPTENSSFSYKVVRNNQ